MQQTSTVQVVNNDQIDERRSYNKEERVKYMELCIKFDNYFANLASILSFSVQSAGLKDENIGIIMEKIIKDLRYLQENYTITKRDFKDNCVMNIFD